MDIDIDVNPDIDPTKVFTGITPASMNEGGVLKRHNVGYYFQHIPTDEKTGLSAITYKNAENFNFFKIDIIHVNLLKEFKSKEQLRDLMHREPCWELFLERKIVEQLFHIHKSFDTVYKVKPTSIIELADCLALIRPNKVKLLPKYLRSKNKEELRGVLFDKQSPSDLRKSHAIPYAYLIIAQLNLLEEKLTNAIN